MTLTSVGGKPSKNGDLNPPAKAAVAELMKNLRESNAELSKVPSRRGSETVLNKIARFN